MGSLDNVVLLRLFRHIRLYIPLQPSRQPLDFLLPRLLSGFGMIPTKLCFSNILQVKKESAGYLRCDAFDADVVFGIDDPIEGTPELQKSGPSAGLTEVRI